MKIKMVLLIIFLLGILVLVSGCTTPSPKKVGSVCDTNVECSSGICTNGYCALSELGDGCNQNSDCAKGLCSGNICQLSSPGNLCFDNGDCGEGYSCFENACRKEGDIFCDANKTFKPFWWAGVLAGILMIIVGFLGQGQNSAMQYSSSGGAALTIFGPEFIGIVLIVASLVLIFLPLC